MKMTSVIAVFTATAIMQACANTPQRQKEVGCAGGAVAGGLAGNNAAGC